MCTVCVQPGCVIHKDPWNVRGAAKESSQDRAGRRSVISQFVSSQGDFGAADRDGARALNTSKVVAMQMGGTEVARRTLSKGPRGSRLPGELNQSFARGGLLMLVSTMPFMFYISIPIKYNFAISDLVIVPLAVLLVARHRTHGQKSIGRWVICITITVLASAFAASLVRINVDTGLLAASIVKLGVGCIYLWVSATLLQFCWQRGDFAWAKAWIRVAVVIAAGTILAATTGLPLSGIFGDISQGRYTGSFQDPNLYATYLATSLSLLLFSQKSRMLLWVYYVVICAAIVLTASRGGAIAGGGTAVLVALVLLVRGGAMRALVLCVVSAGAIWFGVLRSQVLVDPIERITSVDAAMNGRQDIWRAALEVWQESPVLGVGPGQLPVVGASGKVAHNTYIGILAELGIVGWVTILLPVLLMSMVIVFRSGGQRRVTVLLTFPLLLGMLSLSLENVRFSWFIIAALWVAWSCGGQEGSGPRLFPVHGHSVRHRDQRERPRLSRHPRESAAVQIS